MWWKSFTESVKTNNVSIALWSGVLLISPKIQKLLQDFLSDKNLNWTINTDKAVAYGIDVQATISVGEKSDYI